MAKLKLSKRIKLSKSTESTPVATLVQAVTKGRATDAITMNYSEDGVQLVKEVDRFEITSGAWATMAFLYQNLNKSTGKFGETKLAVRRYQKRNGAFKNKSKLNISSGNQAIVIAALLAKWSPQLKQAVVKAEKA
jgi:hypothetical protein